MRFGIQGFGLFRADAGPYPDIFRTVRSAGFRLLEPCIAFGPVPGFERMIWPADRAGPLLQEALDSGLAVESCHVFADNLSACVPRMAELAGQFGIRQFVVKTPPDMSPLSLQQAALRYMDLADSLAGFGAGLLIHNEAEDIRTRVRGKTAYEYLLDLCLGKVDAQVDAGWAMIAGEDPVRLLWRNAHRVQSLHWKDFRGGEETRIGAGELPAEACFQFARAMGIPQIADQDSFPDGVSADLDSVYSFLNGMVQTREKSVSYLNTYDIETGEIRTLHRFDRVIEAPNWLRNENAMLYNSGGRIWRYDIASGAETLVDTGICTGCNNDHVVAPDESAFAVSHGNVTPEEGYTSRIYVIPMSGGQARLVTPESPSYLHGWSPDGKELAYCAFRTVGGSTEVDIYTIPADGSAPEKRLTQGGFNDGPEYSPDGRYIWFNSTRSGLMQIWRMKVDGSEQTRMTSDDRNNWFAHVSPDGKKAVYLSYRRGDLDPREHLPNMQVELWLMNSDGSDRKRIVSFFGGQGSINVNSWAGDSRQFAFISYELLY